METKLYSFKTAKVVPEMLSRMLLQYVVDVVTRAREGSSRKKNMRSILRTKEKPFYRDEETTAKKNACEYDDDNNAVTSLLRPIANPSSLSGC